MVCGIATRYANDPRRSDWSTQGCITYQVEINTVTDHLLLSGPVPSHPVPRSSSYRALPMISVTSTRLHGAELPNGNEGVSRVSATAISTSGSWAYGDYDDGKNNRRKGGGGVGGGRRIVLIEDLPSAFSDEKKARLRRLVAECARSSPCPVVLIWSQVKPCVLDAIALLSSFWVKFNFLYGVLAQF